MAQLPQEEEEQIKTYKRPSQTGKHDFDDDKHDFDDDDGDLQFDKANIFNGWLMGRTLGQGSFGTVKLMVQQKTHRYAAFKIMWAFDRNLEGKLNDFLLKCIGRELKLLNVLKKVQHENVIRMLGVDHRAEYPDIHGKLCCVIALEYAKGGVLKDFVKYTDAFDEKATRSYFHQMIKGLDALHKMGYAHRDLKTSNMLLDEDYVLKIADFGFAEPFVAGTKGSEPGDFLEQHTRSGTLGYRAPEIRRASKGQKYCALKADIFALGVTLFNTFTGHHYPFADAVDSDELWRRFKRGVLHGEFPNKWHSRFWAAHEKHQFSGDLQSLLEKMMYPVPDDNRVGIQAIKQHPWYCGVKYNADQLRARMKHHKETIAKRKQSKKSTVL